MCMYSCTGNVTVNNSIAEVKWHPEVSEAGSPGQTLFVLPAHLLYSRASHPKLGAVFPTPDNSVFSRDGSY